MAPLENHRWKADASQFAVAVHVDDAVNFFANPLVIEPGTRALIVDEGLGVGEVPPGSYSLQTFADKLQFWKKKQATAILVREEDVILDVNCANVPTVENLLVEAVVRVSVQIEDVASFSRNLMGARGVYGMAQLAVRHPSAGGTGAVGIDRTTIDRGSHRPTGAAGTRRWRATGAGRLDATVRAEFRFRADGLHPSRQIRRAPQEGRRGVAVRGGDRPEGRRWTSCTPRRNCARSAGSNSRMN